MQDHKEKNCKTIIKKWNEKWQKGTWNKLWKPHMKGASTLTKATHGH
jgi:hypothetical protein